MVYHTDSMGIIVLFYAKALKKQENHLISIYNKTRRNRKCLN